jgi:hypothetical protein
MTIEKDESSIRIEKDDLPYIVIGLNNLMYTLTEKIIELGTPDEAESTLGAQGLAEGFVIVQTYTKAKELFEKFVALLPDNEAKLVLRLASGKSLIEDLLH